jgi:hypothetical protein
MWHESFQEKKHLVKESRKAKVIQISYFVKHQEKQKSAIE